MESSVKDAILHYSNTSSCLRASDLDLLNSLKAEFFISLLDYGIDRTQNFDRAAAAHGKPSSAISRPCSPREVSVCYARPQKMKKLEKDFSLRSKGQNGTWLSSRTDVRDPFGSLFSKE